MVPFPSITTILYALESPSSLTEISAVFYSILQTRTTNKGATRHLILYAERGVSMISSLSFCPRFIYFLRVRSLFINLPTQNTQVSETKEFRQAYWHEFLSNNKFQTASFTVSCYRGAVVEPQWKDVDARKSLVCKLRNISQLEV